MTLDDVNNGAMQLIPGSHMGALEHERSASTGALLDIEHKIDSSNATVIDLPAGGIMFHHCQTYHYTARNTTDRQRRAFAIHFMTLGTRSLRTGEYLKVSFARPLVRMTI